MTCAATAAAAQAGSVAKKKIQERGQCQCHFPEKTSPMIMLCKTASDDDTHDEENKKKKEIYFITMRFPARHRELQVKLYCSRLSYRFRM